MEGQNSQDQKRKMRYDREMNQLAIKEAFLALIAELGRRPTVAEICERSGLSDKVVRNALKTIRFEALKSPLRILTDDVLIKIFQRATGYEHEAVKIFLSKNPKVTKTEEGTIVSEEPILVPYTEHYPPDPTAAKLWLQVVEGWTEKQEHKHSGEVKITTPPVTLNITRGSKVEREQNSNEGPKAE